MKHYVKIRHRITGQELIAVPTGKTRTENGGGTEAETRILTPKSNLETVWIRREDIMLE